MLLPSRDRIIVEVFLIPKKKGMFSLDLSWVISELEFLGYFLWWRKYSDLLFVIRRKVKFILNHEEEELYSAAGVLSLLRLE